MITFSKNSELCSKSKRKKFLQKLSPHLSQLNVAMAHRNYLGEIICGSSNWQHIHVYKDWRSHRLHIITNYFPPTFLILEGTCSMTYCKHSRSPWNFFRKWLLTLEEYWESFTTQNLSVSLDLINIKVTQIFF